SSYLLYSTWGYRPVSGTDVNLEDDLGDPEIDHNNDYRVNPIISVQNEHQKYTTNNLISNIYGNYKITNFLTLRMTGGLNSRINKNEAFYNSLTARGNPIIPSNSSRGSHGYVNFSETRILSNENTLTYKRKVNKDHVIE